MHVYNVKANVYNVNLNFNVQNVIKGKDMQISKHIFVMLIVRRENLLIKPRVLVNNVKENAKIVFRQVQHVLVVKLGNYYF